jgi:hypothetical protein
VIVFWAKDFMREISFQLLATSGYARSDHTNEDSWPQFKFVQHFNAFYLFFMYTTNYVARGMIFFFYRPTKESTNLQIPPLI